MVAVVVVVIIPVFVMVSMDVTGSPGSIVPEDVTCLRTARGPHAPGSTLPPSCSTTVGRALRYCTSAGAAGALLGTSLIGNINGDQLVGEGRVKPIVVLEQLSPTVSTLT